MQFRQLGSLTVPVIGMGSASSSGFNVESPEGLENCRRILDSCLAAGTTFLDTSPMYRRAEGVIGAGIRGRRHEFSWPPRSTAPASKQAAPRFNFPLTSWARTTSKYFRFTTWWTGAPICPTWRS